MTNNNALGASRRSADAQQQTAYWLGYYDHLQPSDMGRTWPDDQDANEAYDEGRNRAEAPATAQEGR